VSTNLTPADEIIGGRVIHNSPEFGQKGWNVGSLIGDHCVDCVNAHYVPVVSVLYLLEMTGVTLML